MLPPFLEMVRGIGHDVFTNGDYDLNIIGVRSSSRDVNSFDDRMACAYKVDGLWCVEWWEITTDPGEWYLVDNPLNKAGTAILKPGQYRSTYTISKHQGKYDALCQRAGTVSVYRDNNRDRVLDMDERTLQTGMFGINIHRRRGSSDDVDGASAGCQVFRHESAFNRLMTLARKQVSERGWDKFTYTLVDESELW